MSSDTQDDFNEKAHEISDEISNEVDALSHDLASEQVEEFSESISDASPEITEEASEPIKANKKVKTAKRGGGFFSFLTFLFALAALAVSIYTYWKQQELAKTASTNLTAVENTSENLKREMQTELKSYLNTFSTDNETLATQLTKSNRKVARDLKLDVETLSARLSENEAQIVTLKGFSDAAKYAYVKAEIEYFLQTANNRIDLAQDSNTALAAMQAADERLGLLRDPSLRRVRAQVLDEIQALKAIKQPDVEAIALTLASISRQVSSLPLRMDDEKDYYQEEIELKEGTGFRVGMSNVWRNMKGTLDKLVEVRDATPSDVPLMSVEDLNLLYVNLDIQLQSARLASLKGDAKNYQISIDGAEKLLSVYFDTEKSEVTSVLETLAEIKDANLSPEFPDITQSLIMLRNLRNADNAVESSDE